MERPDFGMNGRVALVTGAARGIGLAMARTLAGAGCAVAVQDIDLAVAEAEAQRINDAGGRAVALGGDLTDLSVPAHIVQQTFERLGGLHVLINNAAIQIWTQWTEAPLEDIHRQINADQIAPLLLCQQAAPIFTRQKFGRIINYGTVQLLNNPSGMIAYAMSKAALEHMTRVLAKDLAKHQVTVNMISPGIFDTWRNRETFKTDEDKIKGGKWVPLGRIGEPQDCGGLVLLLCSDAGAYITGQNIYIDGGMGL